jgi:hypothetical protein
MGRMAAATAQLILLPHELEEIAIGIAKNHQMAKAFIDFANDDDPVLQQPLLIGCHVIGPKGDGGSSVGAVVIKRDCGDSIAARPMQP